MAGARTRARLFHLTQHLLGAADILRASSALSWRPPRARPTLPRWRT